MWVRRSGVLITNRVSDWNGAISSRVLTFVMLRRNETTHLKLTTPVCMASALQKRMAVVLSSEFGIFKTVISDIIYFVRCYCLLLFWYIILIICICMHFIIIIQYIYFTVVLFYCLGLASTKAKSAIRLYTKASYNRAFTVCFECVSNQVAYYIVWTTWCISHVNTMLCVYLACLHFSHDVHDVHSNF